MPIDNLTRILQASIAPCVLISGLGLLLLSIANRLGRPIDRIRLLCGDLKRGPREEIPALQKQITILYHRCQLLQTSAALIIVSIILAGLIILMLFTAYLFAISLEVPIEIFFIISLICLTLSLLFFLRDIQVALNSIKIEIKNAGLN